MKHKLEAEIERHRQFQNLLEDKSENAAEAESKKNINMRKYAKYLLKSGSLIEKRELLACLKSRLILKDREVVLEKE
ncbi:MAG: hypothetical protein V1696_01945 [Candidatus Jorgensenbacteria bacterium]